MLWLFVILGVVGLASALHGAVTTWPRRLPTAVALAAILLFAAAWLLGHENAAGWIALAAGIGAECIRRMALAPGEKKQAASHHEPSVAAAGVSTASPIVPVAPVANTEPFLAAPSERSPPPIVSVALLKTRYQCSVDVLLASLKRAGERNARLVRNASSTADAAIEISGILLTPQCVNAPLERELIEEAAAQSWDWPDALAAAGLHASCVCFTARVAAYRPGGDAPGGSGTPRDEVIRALCRAHLALAEFAPLIAVWWPDGGRLVPPGALAGLIEMTDGFRLSAATCVNFRTFPLEGGEAPAVPTVKSSGTPGFVSDTLGLDALDLADVQLVTPDAPDDAASNAIFSLARRQFESGEVPNDGESWPTGETPQWIIRPAKARFGRDRRMIELVCEPESTPDVDKPV